MSVNLNNFAEEVTKEEEGEAEVNIAQTKQIIKIVIAKLAKLSLTDLADVLARHSEL